MADPDIRLGATSCVGCPLSLRLWLGGANLTCFLVSHVYFFVGGGPKSVAKLDVGMAGFAPSGIATGDYATSKLNTK